MEIDREPTFGEKAVGLAFNPSGSIVVNKLKTNYAEIIDSLHELRGNATDDPAGSEVKRLCSVAITEAQTAQMWAVKAVTFGF